LPADACLRASAIRPTASSRCWALMTAGSSLDAAVADWLVGGVAGDF